MPHMVGHFIRLLSGSWAQICLVSSFQPTRARNRRLLPNEEVIRFVARNHKPWLSIASSTRNVPGFGRPYISRHRPSRDFVPWVHPTVWSYCSPHRQCAQLHDSIGQRCSMTTTLQPGNCTQRLSVLPYVRDVRFCTAKSF